MEQKIYIQEAFDLDKAHKIECGVIDGRIVTDQGAKVRILCDDFKSDKYPVGVAVEVCGGTGERFCCVTKDGFRSIGEDPGDGWFRQLYCEVRKNGGKRILTHEEEKRLTSEDMTDACDFFPDSYNMQSAFLTGVAVERDKHVKAEQTVPASAYKPFQKVLVYNSYDNKWFPDFFSHVATDGRIVTITGGFFEENQCQPYKIPLK